MPKVMANVKFQRENSIASGNVKLAHDNLVSNVWNTMYCKPISACYLYKTTQHQAHYTDTKTTLYYTD